MPAKRLDGSRPSCALLPRTVRVVRTLREHPAAVPDTLLDTLSSKFGVVCLLVYRESAQRSRHTTEIRTSQGYPEFADSTAQFRSAANYSPAARTRPRRRADLRESCRRRHTKLDLLRQLQRGLDVSYLFLTRSGGVVAYLGECVAGGQPKPN